MNSGEIEDKRPTAFAELNFSRALKMQLESPVNTGWKKPAQSRILGVPFIRPDPEEGLLQPSTTDFPETIRWDKGDRPLLLRPQITSFLQSQSSTSFNIIMDFLYVPTQYSSENYSSFIDSETANNAPGLSHSSDASSRCSTPKSFDRVWDLEPVTTLSEAIWNPLPRYEDHLNIRAPALQATKNGSLEIFGARHGPHCVSENPLVGNSFDSLMRGLEHQSYSDLFSYVPAYEPLNWSEPPLQPSSDNWPEMSSSSGLFLPAPQPVRAGLNGDLLCSLDSYAYQTDTRATSRTSSTCSTPRQDSSSIRYNPLSTRRETSRGSAARFKDGDDGPAYQHVCSVCSCKFARARDLTRHFRLHTGERPYECSGCNERFIRVDARKRHWNNHPRCLAVHKNLNA